MAQRSTDSAFNDHRADVALCSSDNVVFKLHTIILSLASDFFNDMFALPQPTGAAAADHPTAPGDAEQFDGLPVISVSEPGVVLLKLFRLCYPLDHPSLDSLEEVRAVLTAALKYDCRKAVQIASQKLREFVSAAPMRVYAIACLLSLEEEARIAAQAVREQKAEGTYADELEDLPIGPYQRLLHYCAIAQASVPEGGFCCPARGHPGVLVEPGVSSDASVTLSSSIASIRIIYPAGADDTDVSVDTSDGHQVCVHRTLLRYSSPVLYAMLTQSPSTTSTSISVPETSRIMLILFHISMRTPGYPILYRFARDARSTRRRQKVLRGKGNPLPPTCYQASTRQISPGGCSPSLRGGESPGPRRRCPICCKPIHLGEHIAHDPVREH